VVVGTAITGVDLQVARYVAGLSPKTAAASLGR
jgi:hypothetical protein